MTCLSSDQTALQKARQMIGICTDADIKTKLFRFLNSSDITVWKEILESIKRYVGMDDDVDAVTTYSVESNTSKASVASKRSLTSVASHRSSASRRSQRTEKLTSIFDGLDTPVPINIDYDNKTKTRLEELETVLNDREDRRPDTKEDAKSQFSLSEAEGKSLIGYISPDTIRHKYMHFDKLDSSTYIIPRNHVLRTYNKKYIYDGNGTHKSLSKQEYFTRRELVELAQSTAMERMGRKEDTLATVRTSKLRVKTKTASGDTIVNNVSSDRFNYSQVTPDGHRIDIRVE